MKTIIKAAFFLIACIGNNPCWAFNYFSNQQDTTIVIPDGRFVKGKKLQPYHMNLTSYSITNGQEVKTGSVDDTYQIIKINNKKYGLRIAKIILPGREILDSGLVDLSTLKPVYHHSHQTTKTLLLQFDEKEVRGTVSTGQQTETVNMKFQHPIFDSYYETLIAQSIELKDGFLFKYPDYIYEEGGLVWQSGKVERTNDSVLGKDIWTVSYIDSKSGRKTTYWLDKNRKLKKVEYRFGDRISFQKPEL
jgi:hypothetical protein